MKKRLRCGVLFGGASVEHEISIITAQQMMQAVDRSSWELIPIYVSQDSRYYTGKELFNNAFFKGDFITIDTLKQYIPDIEVIPEMPGALPTDNRIIIWGHKK